MPENRHLKLEDLEGSPEEIIKRIAGYELPTSNGWGTGVVVGAWKLRRQGDDEPHVRLLLACPGASNPVQLFNEDARFYLTNVHGPQNPVTNDARPD